MEEEEDDALEQAVLKVSNIRGFLATLQAIKPSSPKQVGRFPGTLLQSAKIPAKPLTAVPSCAAVHGDTVFRGDVGQVGRRLQVPAELTVPGETGLLQTSIGNSLPQSLLGKTLISRGSTDHHKLCAEIQGLLTCMHSDKGKPHCL